MEGRWPSLPAPGNVPVALAGTGNFGHGGVHCDGGRSGDEHAEGGIATALVMHEDVIATGAKIRDVGRIRPVSYTHLRAHETVLDLVCRLLLEKKKKQKKKNR